MKHFIDDVFETENFASDLFFDKFIGLDWNSFVVDLSVCLFVKEFADDFLGWLSPSDIIFNSLEDSQELFSDLSKDSGVDLSQAEFVQGDALLPGNVLDTSDSDNKQELAIGSLSSGLLLRCVEFFILCLNKKIPEVYNVRRIFVWLCTP